MKETFYAKKTGAKISATPGTRLHAALSKSDQYQDKPLTLEECAAHRGISKSEASTLLGESGLHDTTGEAGESSPQAADNGAALADALEAVAAAEAAQEAAEAALAERDAADALAAEEAAAAEAAAGEGKPAAKKTTTRRTTKK